MTTVPVYRVWNVKHILLIPSYGMVPPCLLLPYYCTRQSITPADRRNNRRIVPHTGIQGLSAARRVRGYYVAR